MASLTDPLSNALLHLTISSPETCVVEDGIDYEVGDARTVLHMKGISKHACANLAASVVQHSELVTLDGIFWTYKTSVKRCWVKLTNEKPKEDSSVVSGSKACGTRKPGS